MPFGRIDGILDKVKMVKGISKISSKSSLSSCSLYILEYCRRDVQRGAHFHSTPDSPIERGTILIILITFN